MDIQKMIMQSMKDKVITEISKKTGLSEDMSHKTIEAALPMIMGGISKNTDSDEGKQAFDTALDNHNESDEIDAGVGSKILGHILGSNQGKVEEAISAEAGISKEEASGVTALLAASLMGILGSAKKSGTNIASEMQQDSMLKSLLTSFLDKDQDGDIKDDLLGMGANFLKKKFM